MKVLNKEKLLGLIAEKEDITEGTRYSVRKCTENTKSFRFGDLSSKDKTEKDGVYVFMGMNEYFMGFSFYKEMVENCLEEVEDTVENRVKYTELGYVFETVVKQPKEKKKK